MRRNTMLLAIGISTVVATSNAGWSAPNIEMPPEVSEEMGALLRKFEPWKWFKGHSNEPAPLPVPSQEDSPRQSLDKNKPINESRPKTLSSAQTVHIGEIERSLRSYYAAAPFAAVTDARIRQHLQQVLDSTSPIAIAVFVGREKQILRGFDKYLRKTKPQFLDHSGIALILSDACDHVALGSFATGDGLESALRYELSQAVEREQGAEGWTFNLQTGELEPPPMKFGNSTLSLKPWSVNLYDLTHSVAEQVGQTSAYLVALSSGQSDSPSDSAKPDANSKLAQEKLRRIVVEEVNSKSDLDVLKANAIGIFTSGPPG